MNFILKIKTVVIVILATCCVCISQENPLLRELGELSKQKTDELGTLIRIIGDTKLEIKLRQNAVNDALDLFDDYDRVIEVSSARTKQIKKYKVRQYLNHLLTIGGLYDKVEINWKYIQIITNVHLKDDGFYYGTVRVYQRFNGQGKDGNDLYKDVTIKDIEVRLEKKEIDKGGLKPEEYFIVKFRDITVISTDKLDSKKDKP